MILAFESSGLAIQSVGTLAPANMEIEQFSGNSHKPAELRALPRSSPDVVCSASV
jgi:hypothetical protein